MGILSDLVSGRLQTLGSPGSPVPHRTKDHEPYCAPPCVSLRHPSYRPRVHTQSKTSGQFTPTVIDGVDQQYS